jgi:hypothetical protein
MPEPMLPPSFSDVEHLAPTWCLPTGEERFAQRMASTMDEMRQLYEAMFDRIAEALAYCDSFPLDDLPDDARHLLELVHSTITVAMCIEVWHQPQVISAADARLTRVGEPLP